MVEEALGFSCGAVEGGEGFCVDDFYFGGDAEGGDEAGFDLGFDGGIRGVFGVDVDGVVVARPTVSGDGLGPWSGLRLGGRFGGHRAVEASGDVGASGASGDEVSVGFGRGSVGGVLFAARPIVLYTDSTSKTYTAKSRYRNP